MENQSYTFKPTPVCLAAFVAAATLLASGCSKKEAAHLTTPNEPVFQRGLQNRAIPEMVDPNTVRVLISGSSRINPGARADKFGFARPGTPGAGHAEVTYDKGQFREYSIQTESTGNLGATIGPAGKFTGEHSIDRYRLVYEWSRFSSISDHATASANKPYDWSSPHVSAVDVGFAVRLLMELTITKTEATANLALGPANLEAAFALGAASISAKYDIVGTTASFLPSTTTTIESLAEYEKARKDFHERAKQLEDILGRCGELRPLPDTGKAGAAKEKTAQAAGSSTADAAETAPTDDPSASAPEPKDPVTCEGLKLTPTVLAYESSGEGVGFALEQLQRQQGECREAREHASSLRSAFDALPLAPTRRKRRRRRELAGLIYEAQLRLEDCQAAFTALVLSDKEPEAASPEQVGVALKSQGFTGNPSRRSK